jgi:hypothetical protein
MYEVFTQANRGKAIQITDVKHLQIFTSLQNFDFSDVYCKIHRIILPR